MACKKARGKRAKTRDKFKMKGTKLSVSRELAEVAMGAKAQITVNPSMHSGMPVARYQGRTVDVVGKQGSMLNVSLMESKGKKNFLVHPAHLTLAKKEEAS
ncbi:MAG: 50S ribosomal protein L21e [Candidatus Diapherotrites archaeon]|nr:50S ribosomal protein L21e [Candidatus Diapherotrites archaeon]